MRFRTLVCWVAGLSAILAGALFTCGCAKRQPVTSATSGIRPAEASQEDGGDKLSRPDPGIAGIDPRDAAVSRPPRQSGGNGGAVRPPDTIPPDRDPFDAGPATSPRANDKLYTVPKGTSAELTAYQEALTKRRDELIDQIESPRATRTGQMAAIAEVKRLAAARIAAADQVLADDKATKDQQRIATQAKLDGLSILVKAGEPGAEQRQLEFAQTLAEAEDPQIRRTALVVRLDRGIDELESDPDQKAAQLVADVETLLGGDSGELTKTDFTLAQDAAQALLQSQRVADAVGVLRLMGKAFADSPDAALAEGARSLAMQGHMVEMLDASRRLEAGDEAAAELLTTSAKQVLAGENVEPELLLAMASISAEVQRHHGAAAGELSALVVTGVERLLGGEKLNADMVQAVVSRVAVEAEYGGNVPLAAKIYEAASAALAKIDDAEAVETLRSTVSDGQKRVGLIGKPLAVSGVLADGKPFDWEAYKGKVVLVDFWATWCQPCLAELPNIRANFQKYHDQGFEVIGVNLDDEVSQAEAFFKERGRLPWTTVYGPDEKSRGFETPLAKECGVSAIPFLVFIGKDGKVLAIHVRGEELGKRLAEIFGDAEESAVDEVPPADDVPSVPQPELPVPPG